MYACNLKYSLWKLFVISDSLLNAYLKEQSVINSSMRLCSESAGCQVS